MLVDTEQRNDESCQFEIEKDLIDDDEFDFDELFDYEEVLKYFEKEDIGDACIYRKLYKERFVYHFDKQMWFKYVGPHWEPDYSLEAVRGAELVFEIYKHFLNQ
ncbi:hypothetical protein SAMN06295888_13810 [Desulfonatronum zhilinae]|nr:hypothetical protein SAMN06295888_13810 [Desulfonatronum zhilinae]